MTTPHRSPPIGTGIARIQAQHVEDVAEIQAGGPTRPAPRRARWQPTDSGQAEVVDRPARSGPARSPSDAASATGRFAPSAAVAGPELALGGQRSRSRRPGVPVQPATPPPRRRPRPTSRQRSVGCSAMSGPPESHRAVFARSTWLAWFACHRPLGDDPQPPGRFGVSSPALSARRRECCRPGFPAASEHVGRHLGARVPALRRQTIPATGGRLGGLANACCHLPHRPGSTATAPAPRRQRVVAGDQPGADGGAGLRLSRPLRRGGLMPSHRVEQPGGVAAEPAQQCARVARA